MRFPREVGEDVYLLPCTDEEDRQPDGFVLGAWFLRLVLGISPEVDWRYPDRPGGYGLNVTRLTYHGGAFEVREVV